MSLETGAPRRARTRDVAWLVMSFALPCLPLIFLYLYNHAFEHVFSPYSAQLTTAHASMGWHNFWNVIPGNLVYSELHNLLRQSSTSVGGTGSGKTGLSASRFPSLALIGAVASFRATRFYAPSCSCFFSLLSFGVGLPGFQFLTNAPLGEYFRVPPPLLLVRLDPPGPVRGDRAGMDRARPARLSGRRSGLRCCCPWRLPQSCSRTRIYVPFSAIPGMIFRN